MIHLRADFNIKSFENKFYLEAMRLVNKNSRVLCATSGGPDSVFMLYMFAKAGYNIIAGHVNHGFRKNSKLDEKFVRNFSKKLGVDFSSVRLNMKTFTEAKARILRYRALKKIAYKKGIKYIATAHTLDDNFETILFNFFTRGLTKSIPEVRTEGEYKIIRPLLKFKKSDIVFYLNTLGIPYRIDESNFDLRFSRNYIRHVIIPKILERFPSADLLAVKYGSEN